MASGDMMKIYVERVVVVASGLVDSECWRFTERVGVWRMRMREAKVVEGFGNQSGMKKSAIEVIRST